MMEPGCRVKDIVGLSTPSVYTVPVHSTDLLTVPVHFTHAHVGMYTRRCHHELRQLMQSRNQIHSTNTALLSLWDHMTTS